MKSTQLTNSYGIPMPLIMNYTPYKKIEEGTNDTTNFIYDDNKQTVVYNMRTVGTRSLRHNGATYKTKGGKRVLSSSSDAKNSIDDSKTVK